jgi:hypothetical protein
MTTCRVCRRVLKNPKWAALGIGPICASKQAIAEAADNKQPLLVDVGPLEVAGLVCRRQGDGQLACNVPQRFVWHSPTGFECGYGGSGPADLALNVLAALVPLGSDGAEGWKIYDGQSVSATAGLLHQDFKNHFIARMPKQGATVDISLIRAWLNQKRTEQAFIERLALHTLVPA